MFRRPFHTALITYSLLSAVLLGTAGGALRAGGGLVLENDKCIVKIDFYSAHFTAYQPTTSGNRQFCRELPEAGDTLFVLDYLHQSMKEVPVSFRILRDFTGQGRFVKLKHLEDESTVKQNTVFFQPPVVRPDASLTVEYEFAEEGAYLGIVTVGHPTSDRTYAAVFPFQVGGSGMSWLLPAAVLLAIAGALGALWRRPSRLANPDGVPT